MTAVEVDPAGASREDQGTAVSATILIADDDSVSRKLLGRLLMQDGHEVRAAADGVEALELFAVGGADIVLLDIVMPGLDGIALALKASKDHPAMRILLMTGFAAERQRAHNLEALIHTVITKPFSLDEIVAAVAAALAE